MITTGAVLWQSNENTKLTAAELTDRQTVVLSVILSGLERQIKTMIDTWLSYTIIQHSVTRKQTRALSLLHDTEGMLCL